MESRANIRLAAEKISPNSDSLGTAVEILGRIFVCSSMFHVGRAFIGIGSWIDNRMKAEFPPPGVSTDIRKPV